MKKSIVKLKNKEEARVVAIAGGREAARRLEALGVRVGKTVKKVHSMLFRGPVTIQIGQTKVSVGHGLAEKIMVEDSK